MGVLNNCSSPYFKVYRYKQEKKIFGKIFMTGSLKNCFNFNVNSGFKAEKTFPPVSLIMGWKSYMTNLHWAYLTDSFIQNQDLSSIWNSRNPAPNLFCRESKSQREFFCIQIWSRMEFGLGCILFIHSQVSTNCFNSNNCYCCSYKWY